MSVAQDGRSERIRFWPTLSARRARRGPEPLLTFVDARQQDIGERTELSAISVENAVAKIANALREEFDIGPGSRVGLHLPWHWQRGLWWGACAAVGAEAVPYAEVDEVDLTACTIAQVSSLSLPPSGEILVVSLHPFGLPSPDPLPDGFVDATAIVRAQPDAFWTDTTTELTIALPNHLAWPDRAAPGQRTLVACPWGDRIDAPQSWTWPLAIPLALGGSVVMVAVGPNDEHHRAPSAHSRTRWPILETLAAQERVDEIVVIDPVDS